MKTTEFTHILKSVRKLWKLYGNILNFWFHISLYE